MLRATDVASARRLRRLTVRRFRVAATQVEVGMDVERNLESDPGVDTSWNGAELDPELLERVREQPAFPLRKRRPETYGELTRPL